MSLITAQQVIDLNTIQKNIDPVLISADDIQLAQERYLKAALGEKLYDKIVEQFEGGEDSDSDTEGLSPENQTLLDNHILRTLAKYVLYECLPTIYLAIGSQGVMENFTDYSRQSTKSNVSYMRDVMLNKADFYRDEMVKFLIKNIKDYPLFKDCIPHSHKKTSFIIH